MLIFYEKIGLREKKPKWKRHKRNGWHAINFLKKYTLVIEL